MHDPIEKLADDKLYELAADVMVQLERGTGTRPVLYMVDQARARAAKAILMMMDVDAENASDIRKLQAEMKLYDDMIASARMMLQRGRNADSKIREANRAEIEDLAHDLSPEERRLYQLQPQGSDA